METVNLSKIKRDKLIKQINSLKKDSDEDTVSILNIIENELLMKKYGLIWENHLEEVSTILENKFPIFVEEKEKEIITDKNLKYNFLLEGDNLHSLKLLEKTHSKNIDFIYIDPPYNTKNKEFIYDDNMVGEDDGFRHSKWLSFMSRRLDIAKKLLTDDGLIFISIDDNEQAQLKLLCDSIFNEENYCGMFMWYKSATPPNLSKKMKKNIEYILCYQRVKNSDKFKGYATSSPSNDPTTKPQNTLKVWTFQPGQLEIPTENKIIKAGIYGTKKYPNKLLNDLIVIDGTNKNEVSFENKFIWTQETLQETLQNTKMFLSSRLVLSYKRTEYENSVPTNFINMDVGVGTTEEAGRELDELFGVDKIFDYPKPVSLIKYLLNFIDKKDITVLDFFAGSGTTAHAVLELNNEDKGSRKFILCTNNENNICEEITYKRIKAIITGKMGNKKISDIAISANLKYFKTKFLDKKYDGNMRAEFMKFTNELLELKYHCPIGINNIVVSNEDELDLLLLKKEVPYNRVFISDSVFLTEDAESYFKDNNIDIYLLPNTFFFNELREVGEI